ncbi:glycosyltransferase [Crenobacter sp. SG2305]|uniref:MraY family glycosyltransferase n=1 Tax=Crenobacter oryzisoli TaxID=3056844 RepID=UPI0025AA4C16|nr:glycosyltransferase [Crenobacter sp. SG2305]MDN0082139.1 glycosyltransferase [Crenobacter sp. SG2305]
MLMIVFGALLASFLMGVLIIRFQHVHARFTADHDLNGVQKFHATPVPRIGGVPVMAGIVAGTCVASFKWPNIEMWLLLASSLPAYLAGLTEDVTKRIGPLPRLLATFVAAMLGFWLLKAGLSRLAIPGVDSILERYWFLSLLFTVFAVGGVAHAINIIDGYNGLAGMVSIFIFLALAYVSFKVGDSSLLGLSLAVAGGIAGFLCWNFPRGLIFAGDGGAYLIGFLIAEVSVLLVARHPQVSPWFPLLLVIYPVFETLFSIYRRKFLQGRSVGYPDALHLHQMVYKRLVRWMVGSREARHLTHRNSLTSPYLWVLTSLAVIPAMLFWDNTTALLGFVVLFVLAYVGLYRMIIRFRTPGWLVLRKKRKH